MEQKGVDLSVHNGPVDMVAIREAGYDFAMLRAGYGRELKQKDCRFEENYRKAEDAGMPVGAYWYSYARDAAGARLEADCCAQVIAGKRFAYPIAFDLEDAYQKDLGRETLTQIAVTFLSRMEELGYYVMLYANLDWLRNRLDYDAISRYDIWLAQWRPDGPTYEHPIGMWQYTSDAEVPGSSARTDCNVAYRDYPSIIRAAGLNGFAEEAAPAVPDYPEPSRLIKQGCTGDDVKWVQKKLCEAGYDVGSAGVDGVCGTQTVDAIRQVQRDNGLTVDRIVGPNTRAALKGCNPFSEPADLLRSGDTGEGVKWVQWALKRRGYGIGGTGIDGKYGPATQTAVERFQRDNGLVADGIVGPDTRGRLEDCP